MLTAIVVAALCSAPPEEGLVQRFQRGDVFQETLDVTVTSLPAGDASPTSLHYEIDLDTVTLEVESEEAAALDSRVVRLLVETTAGDTLSAKYDSADRRVIGSVDATTIDSDTLADLWLPYRGTSIRRTATTDGSLSMTGVIGLPIEARDTATTAAFKNSLSTLLSTKLPSGPIESWTEKLQWPTGKGDIPVLRLYTYAGRNADGLDRIDISSAAVGEDGVTRLEDPPLVARGSIYFDRSIGRVTILDLIVEMKRPQVTRTNIAWRLKPATELRDPLAPPPAR